MNSKGDLLTWSEGRRFAIVSMTISATIIFFALIFLLSKLSYFREMNYYGLYEDEIRMYTTEILIFSGLLLWAVPVIFAVHGQNIYVYENMITGVARKNMHTNRQVEIRYKDIRDVNSSSALVKIRTATDEIHFCVNDSEYVAGQIRYQWNKVKNQTSKKKKSNTAGS